MQTELSNDQMNAILKSHFTAHGAFFDGLLPFAFPLYYLMDGSSLVALLPADKVTKRMGNAMEICLEIDEGKINNTSFNMRVWGKTKDPGSLLEQKKIRQRFAERLQIPLHFSDQSVSHPNWDAIRTLQEGKLLRVQVSFKSGYLLEKEPNEILVPVPNIVQLPALKRESKTLEVLYAS